MVNLEFPPEEVSHLRRQYWEPDLSPAERKVLHYVLLGCSNKEVGFELGITERTVKFHMTRILKKSNYSSRSFLLSSYIPKKQLLNRGFI